MRYDDGIATKTPADFWLEQKRREIYHRTDKLARLGRLHGLYCHDLPHLGALMPDRMAEALCVTTKRLHTAIPGGELFSRCDGWRVTRAGQAWTLPPLGHHVARAVVCLDTGEKYASIKEAAEAHGINKTTLGGAMRGHRTAGGKRFKYEGEGDVVIVRRSAKAPRAVVCVETGETHESINAASRAIGQGSNAVLRACREGVRAGGFGWRYADSPQVQGEATRRIVCVETGALYRTMREAARAIGQPFVNGIYRAIKQGSLACGFHWRYEHVIDVPKGVAA